MVVVAVADQPLVVAIGGLWQFIGPLRNSLICEELNIGQAVFRKAEDARGGERRRVFKCCCREHDAAIVCERQCECIE